MRFGRLPRAIRHILPAIALCLLACGPAEGRAQRQGDVSNHLMAYLRQQMAIRHIPGLQIAVVRHGRIILRRSLGTAYLQDSVPVDNDTVFPIFSITKAFTGVAAMQLAEAGRLDLSAPVSHYLDDLPPAWRAITVRQLLTNMTGLPNIIDNDTGRLAADGEAAALAAVEAMPVRFPPGDRFDYSQTNYLLVGKILDRAAGEPFMQWISEHQLRRVGMPHAVYGDDGEVIPHSARSYVWLPDPGAPHGGRFVMPFVVYPYPESMMTAAGLNTTAGELAHWLTALQQGRLLAAGDSLRSLWTAGRLNDGTTEGFSPLLNGYALGWPVVGRARHPAVAPIGGGRCAMFVYPRDDLAVIVLTNGKGAEPEAFMDEVAGFYLPDMRSDTGFGFPEASRRLHAYVMSHGGYGHLAEGLAAERRAGRSGVLGERDWTELGVHLFSLGEHDNAIAALRENTAQHPDDAHAWEMLASVYELTGQSALAAATRDAAARIRR